MAKPKNLEQLRAEKEQVETQLAQEQHKLERLENRKKYLEKGERTKRTHRLCNLGGTIESLAPEVKDLTRTEMTELMEHIFSLAEVKRAVRQKIDLTVADAVFHQRALGGTDADYFFQRVIRRADGTQQLVARQQIRAQRDGQRMRSAGDLRADKRGLRAEGVRVDLFQLFAAHIVVAVAGRCGKARRVHAVFMHGAQNLRLIIFRSLVDGGEALL